MFDLHTVEPLFESTEAYALRHPCSLHEPVPVDQAVVRGLTGGHGLPCCRNIAWSPGRVVCLTVEKRAKRFKHFSHIQVKGGVRPKDVVKHPEISNGVGGKMGQAFVEQRTSTLELL